MDKEIIIVVDSVFKQMQKMVLHKREMFERDFTVCSCIADDFGGSPREDSIGSKSFVQLRDGRMIKALR